MKVLITGGFGYLGGRLAQYLMLQAGYEIVLGSRHHACAPDWLPDAEVLQTRWDDPASLDRICEGVDAVVHLAGANAQDCAADPVAAVEINALATARLLQSAIRRGVKRFLYLSTAHVYASPLVGVITEEGCPSNLHPYASSHRAGEDAVRAVLQSGRAEGVVIRLSNAYGAPAHDNANCWMLLVNDLCRQGLSTGRMVLRSAQQRRDFVTLTVACSAIRHLLEVPSEKLGSGLFNVGGRWAPTVLEMAARVAERISVATGQKPEIVTQTDDGGGAESLDFRMDRIIASGFRPGFADGIDQEIDRLVQFCLALKG